MKLRKVTSNDPLERHALSIHHSVGHKLQTYRRYYKSVHGDEISMSLLVESMCKRLMEEDREFQKFVAAMPAPASGGASTK